MWHPEDDNLNRNVCLYFVGTAGCGKSTMTAGYAEWLELRGIKPFIINLDPGVHTLPYEPDFDIRNYLTVSSVMEEHGLGPNGAQVVCADMMALHLPDIKKMLDASESEVILVDTPGQLELFIDPFNAHTPTGLVSQLMLSALTRLRFSIPALEVMSKADMMDKTIIEKLEYWGAMPDNLLEDVMGESAEMGTVDRELGSGMYRVLEDMGLFGNLRRISSTDGTGMESIYEMAQLNFGGGEDLETDD